MLQFHTRKLQSYAKIVTSLALCMLNVMFCVGLLPPGSGRDKDLCMEREEGEQSGKAGCYGQSFGEGALCTYLHESICSCVLPVNSYAP